MIESLKVHCLLVLNKGGLSEVYLSFDFSN